MTKKKPKISYRDLLAKTPEAMPAVAPVVLPPPAPPPSPAAAPAAASPAPAADVEPSPVDLAVVLNPGIAHQRTPAAGVHVVIPEPVAALVRALTPRPGQLEVAPATPSPDPPATLTPARVTPVAPGSAAPARARATRATRAMRATVAGRALGVLTLRDALAERGHAELLRFRVGSERFALRLSEVEEAVESPVLHPLPEMRRGLLGVCALRGRLVPVYAPSQPLGVRLDTPTVALVLAGLARPLAIAVDDVEDVFTLTAAELRGAPGTDDPDGVLLGVTRHRNRLVSVLDGAALAAACIADPALETA